MSLLLYYNEEQYQTANAVKEEIENAEGESIQTEIASFQGFTKAEDYHQKYYLKRFPQAIAHLSRLFTDHQEMVNSTLAARLNGLVKGYGTMEDIKRDLTNWELTREEENKVIECINTIRW